MDIACQLLERFCFVDDDPCGMRVLVVAAHPDDETVGMAGRLGHLRDVWILHVSDGAPRDPRFWSQAAPSLEEYRSLRRAEAEFALSLAGIGPDRIRCLGFQDQELACSLGPIIEALADEISRLHPEVIVTHPYEGGHPDHDATAFAVRAALSRQNRHPDPPLLEMTSYHLGSGGNPVPGSFLPRAESRRCETVTRALDTNEAGLKRQMFDAFASQKSVLDLLFSDVERFRLAPDYDFEKPPHEGVLFYETRGWSLTGEEFRRQVAAVSQRT